LPPIILGCLILGCVIHSIDPQGFIGDRFSGSSPGAKVSRLFPQNVLYQYPLSLTHSELQAGTANQRHTTSTAANLLSTFQSRNKKKEHQWQNKEQ